MARGRQFLLHSQQPSGWFSEWEPATTALAIRALVRCGVSPDTRSIQQSLNVLQDSRQSDGGFYNSRSEYPELETCLVLLCFAECNRPLEAATRKKTTSFLYGYHWTAAHGIDESHSFYGGFGRGQAKRPNVAATMLFLDVGRGYQLEDFAAQRSQMALQFVIRSQRMDGGFGAHPPTFANVTGALEDMSFGYLTADGLRGLAMAKEERRMAAAGRWLQMNSDLDTNPGLASGGLYSYYRSLAHALSDAPTAISSDDGRSWNWRRDLIKVLLEKQRTDGSWRNDDSRWNEDDPRIATAHALVALTYCLPQP